MARRLGALICKSESDEEAASNEFAISGGLLFRVKGNHQFRFPLICQWLQKVHHSACLHNIANDKHKTTKKLFEITQHCQNKEQRTALFIQDGSIGEKFTEIHQIVRKDSVRLQMTPKWLQNFALELDLISLQAGSSTASNNFKIFDPMFK